MSTSQNIRSGVPQAASLLIAVAAYYSGGYFCVADIRGYRRGWPGLQGPRSSVHREAGRRLGSAVGCPGPRLFRPVRPW